MKPPVITPDCVETLLDKRFVRVFDIQYAPGRHYFDATRREKDALVALKSEDEAKTMLPDAVSCVVTIAEPGEEPRLLLSMEYRYPAGRFLLSVPAGLIDPEDREGPDPLLTTARREIREETGIILTEEDTLQVLSPFVYSTPGMTDESNALVSVQIRHKGALQELNQNGAEGSELFDGFVLLTKEQAREVLSSGRDASGNFYSLYTWAALMEFLH